MKRLSGEDSFIGWAQSIFFESRKYGLSEVIKKLSSPFIERIDQFLFDSNWINGSQFSFIRLIIGFIFFSILYLSISWMPFWIDFTG